MLRPSRPMIRPFISSDGRWTTETVCSAVWSAATRWMAVTTMSRALSWASSRALRSIARAILTASCSASSRTASRRMPLASSADMFGDALERGDLLAVGAGQLLAGLVELALAVQELAVALLEHVRALVELLVALRGGGARGWPSSARRARASSSASRCRRSFSSLASRISSFWRARASASIRRASAVAAFIVWDAQRLRSSMPTTAPPTAATTATARMSRGSIIRSSHPADCGPDVRESGGCPARSIGDGRDRATAGMRAVGGT